MKKQSKRSPSKKTQTKNQISAGAIVFYVESKAIKILFLVQNNAYYPGRISKEEVVDIGPKGHVEHGESMARAAHREIREEIGIPLHMDTGFRREENYVFYTEENKRKVRINKKVVYFLAFMQKHDIKEMVLSQEHSKRYLLPIDEAIERAKFPNQKELLRDAKEYIMMKYLI